MGGLLVFPALNNAKTERKEDRLILGSEMVDKIKTHTPSLRDIPLKKGFIIPLGKLLIHWVTRTSPLLFLLTFFLFPVKNKRKISSEKRFLYTNS